MILTGVKDEQTATQTLYGVRQINYIKNKAQASAAPHSFPLPCVSLCSDLMVVLLACLRSFTSRGIREAHSSLKLAADMMLAKAGLACPDITDTHCKVSWVFNTLDGLLK